jgi:hypothetical protein
MTPMTPPGPHRDAARAPARPAPRAQLAGHVARRHLAYAAIRAEAIDPKETWS